jgi:hypothetical protein
VYRWGAKGTAWSPASPRPGASTLLDVGPDRRLWAFGPASTTHVSSDDGSTWQAVPGAPVAIWRMAFDGALTAFAATTSGLYRSSDGGQTWSPTTLPATYVSAVLVERPGVVWAAVGLDLYRSQDSGIGSTWTRIPLNATVLVPHAEGGVLAGGFGVHRVTDDGTVSPLGLPEHRITALRHQPSGALLAGSQGVCGLGWCSGGGTYRSTDAGATWQPVPGAGVAARFTARRDGQIVAISAGYGEMEYQAKGVGIVASADGGATWATRNDGIRPAPVVRLAIAPGSGVLAAATETSLYRSEDHGTSWELVQDFGILWGPQHYPRIEPAVFPIGDVVWFVTDALYGWPYDSNGLDRTTMTAAGVLLGTRGDGIGFKAGPGAPVVLIPQSPLVRVIEAGPFRRVAAAGRGDFEPAGTYLSEDGASPWQLIAPIGGELAWAPDETTLYVAGQASIHRLREPSWAPEALPALPETATRVLDIAVDAAGAVYALVPDALLRLRSDETAWSKLADVPSGILGPFGQLASELAFDPDGYLYVSTAQGIFRSAGPLGSGTTDLGDTAGGSLASVRVYPMPFRSQAHIEFALDRASDVDLTVYDVRGRRVDTLLRRADLQPGPQAASWRPRRDLPNGVYVYRLRVNGGERIGRLLLVR